MTASREKCDFNSKTSFSQKTRGYLYGGSAHAAGRVGKAYMRRPVKHVFLPGKRIANNMYIYARVCRCSVRNGGECKNRVCVAAKIVLPPPHVIMSNRYELMGAACMRVCVRVCVSV